MPALVRHLPDWTHWMRVHGQSPATIQSYGYQLKHLVTFCAVEGVGKVEDVDRDCLRRYWTWLKTSPKPYSLHSLGVKCRAVKSFFAFLLESGVVTANPADILSHPDNQRRLPKQAPTHAQVMALLAVPDTTTLGGLRDRAMMEVLYSTGMRVGECVALTVFDVDIQGGVVRVNEGKGRKDREAPLGVEATRWLRRYVEQVRPAYAVRADEPTEALWLGRRGNAPSTQQVQANFRKYRVGDLTPHSLRRALATGMLSNGADIGAIKGILGHASIHTTALYAQALAVDVKKTHDQTHPRQRSTEPEARALPRLRLRKNLYARSH